MHENTLNIFLQEHNLAFLFIVANLVTVEELSRTSGKNDIEQITSSDVILQDVQIVLVATSEHAKLAVLTYLNPSKNSKLCCCVLHSNMSCIIGRFGSCVTAVMLNERTLQTTKRIVFNSFPNLCAVFAVGEAYGIMRHVKMWDVLVSSKLYMATFNHNGKLERDTSSILTVQFFCEWFNQPPHWPGKDNKIVSHLNDANLSSPCLKHGNILSWNCSNDDITELDLLSVCSDDIIGIDMDGTASLSDYCRRNNIHFMIVKAIGHLGDSKYDRVCQPTAALLAADCLHHYLSDPQLSHKLAASRGLWITLLVWLYHCISWQSMLFTIVFYRVVVCPSFNTILLHTGLPYPFVTSSVTGQHASSTCKFLKLLQYITMMLSYVM